MKHQSKSKAARKPQTKDELFDAMIPQRDVDKTAEMLEKHKAKHEPGLSTQPILVSMGSQSQSLFAQMQPMNK